MTTASGSAHASETHTETESWPPTRDEGLRRVAAFVPRAGRAYASTRNLDLGAGHHENVSQLSPYVRARLIAEPELLRSVLARHSPTAAYKFISEVFWRTYWKGWLEARPSVWNAYLGAVTERANESHSKPEPREALRRAESGETGIEPFDAWVRELVATGYLHNHARMWFASIWIFTLELPWELGADFFMRRLLCGDPASNTLSWRWVAGLHTRGKTYLARPSNIARYTEGRFTSTPGLATRASALEGPAYPIEREATIPLALPSDPVLLLLHDDDCGFDMPELAGGDVRATHGLVAAGARSPRGIAPAALDFARGAVANAVDSASSKSPSPDRVPSEPSSNVIEIRDVAGGDERTAAADALVVAATNARVTTILTPFAPVGPVRDALDALRPALATRGMKLVEIGRRYDALAYPHATRGFFQLRSKIPGVMTELGLWDEATDRLL